MQQKKLNVAVVGCGFVSAYYMETINRFPNFVLKGICDKIPEKAKNQAEFYKTQTYQSLDSIVEDASVDIVINLTDPENHYEVSKKALNHGKHVYCEKPMCVSLDESMELAQLAKSKNLWFISAPCSLLGPTAQTIWKALDDGKVGKPKLVYAEMDDGPVYLMNPDTWRSRAGAAWPYKGEFRLGSGPEHLGYALTWLVAFFGPVTHLTSYSNCIIAKKMPDMEELTTPDFSVAVITHDSGVVTRLTCGIVAPVNRGMTIVGETGTISISDFWDIYDNVGLLSYSSLKLKAERKPWINNNWLLKRVFGIIPKKLPLIKKKFHNRLKHTTMDYCLGIYNLADAILNEKSPILSTDFCVHINELTLKIHHSMTAGKCIDTETTFNHDEFKKLNSDFFA